MSDSQRPPDAPKPALPERPHQTVTPPLGNVIVKKSLTIPTPPAFKPISVPQIPRPSTRPPPPMIPPAAPSSSSPVTKQMNPVTRDGLPKPAPSPPAPAYGPAPAPPYQSQIVGPGFSQPPYPRKPERGTLPAIPVAQPQTPLSVTPQMPQVAQRPATIPVQQNVQQPQFGQANRIMVQYPQVGSKLVGARGSYEVRDVIGSGEFGAVYEATGPFDQSYAVKMVRPANRPYAEVHAEWSKEVSRLFTLRHPNVVYIYDSFTQDHLFYLALERCDHALKSMLGSPMQEGLVLEISRQLLAAVQFLHDNDVVHDDLHGGNVLITHTDRPTVKISDFGISHELRGMAAVRPNVVHHAIMAPEILATGYTSRQSDLYQVGLLLYWMLVGESAMEMEVPYQELVRQVAEGEPRQRAEQLGTPFGDLIAKMLRRREAFRYTSAREVWADLRELDAWKQRDLFPVK